MSPPGRMWWLSSKPVRSSRTGKKTWNWDDWASCYCVRAKHIDWDRRWTKKTTSALQTTHNTQVNWSNYTQGNNTWIFSCRMSSTDMYTPTFWTDAPHVFFCFPFHKICLLLKTESVGFRPFVFPILIFCFLEYIFSSNSLFSNNCKENRWSCSPFRLSNHLFWGTQLWLSVVSLFLAYLFSRLSQTQYFLLAANQGIFSFHCALKITIVIIYSHVFKFLRENIAEADSRTLEEADEWQFVTKQLARVWKIVVTRNLPLLRNSNF